MSNRSQPLARLAYWINERESIRISKESGQPWPWTDDPILRQYRFCNVQREHDAVTLWIKRNWREPHAKDLFLWHAMVVARYINWPATLAECGWPEPWSQAGNEFFARMQARESRGEKVFTGAYIISNGGMAASKIDVVRGVIKRAWVMPNPPCKGDTLQAAYRKLLGVFGIGSFMAAQVIADLKQTPVLQSANDWWCWAAPGPGSQRGLNRVLGRQTKAKWDDYSFVRALIDLRRQLQPHAPIVGELCLQDLQNCLCEFDKFERTANGEGAPRAKYNGGSMLRLAA